MKGKGKTFQRRARIQTKHPPKPEGVRHAQAFKSISFSVQFHWMLTRVRKLFHQASAAVVAVTKRPSMKITALDEEESRRQAEEADGTLAKNHCHHG